MKFSSKEVAQGTGLTVRQVQHHVEKNVVFKNKIKVGRGLAYEFDDDDIIKFLIIRECLQFNLNYKMKKKIINYFFENLQKVKEVKTFREKKLFLEKGEYFYIWFERPKKGEYEEIFGLLISNSQKNFDKNYFHPLTNSTDGPQFNGFKFEENSSSIMLIDFAGILRKQHNFLLEVSFEKPKVGLKEKNGQKGLTESLPTLSPKIMS